MASSTKKRRKGYNFNSGPFKAIVFGIVNDIVYDSGEIILELMPFRTRSGNGGNVGGISMPIVIPTKLAPSMQGIGPGSSIYIIGLLKNSGIPIIDAEEVIIIKR